MKKEILGVFIWLGVLTSLVIYLSFTGCVGIQKPDRDDFKLESGYMTAFCSWLNAKSEHKVDCIAIFNKWNKEHVFDKCLDKKNRPDNMTFDSCIKYLD